MKLYKFHFIEKESDVSIISEVKKAILIAKEAFYYHRGILDKYIEKHDEFRKSFSPVKITSNDEIIQIMADAALACDVGPMAAVAGALADLMLKKMMLEDTSSNLPAKVNLVENGGEIINDSEEEMKVALFAGHNQLNLNIGFLLTKTDCPIGIGTSSATIGHAISLGQADAATVFADNATLADAAATKIGNLVKGPDVEKSIKRALDAVDELEGVRGAFISREDKIGQVGKLPKIFKIEGDKEQIFKKKLDSILPGEYEIFK